MKIINQYNPKSVYPISPALKSELAYKLREVTREDEGDQMEAEDAMAKIEAKNFDLTKLEFREFLQALRDIEAACDYAIDSYIGATITRAERKSIAEYRSMRKEIRLLFISWGIYRHVTDEELSNTIVSGGRPGAKKYDFIHAGKKYEFASWNVPGSPI